MHEITPPEHCSSADSGRRPTLKGHIAELIGRDVLSGGQNEPTPESLSLHELKLEADSRIAILMSAVMASLPEQTISEVVSERIKKAQTAAPQLNALEVVRDDGLELYGSIFMLGIEHLQKQASTASFFEGLEKYREAYHKRSPQAHDKDINYGSLQSLAVAGIGTATEHFPLLIYSLHGIARIEGLTGVETIALVRDSGHLPLTLAKFKLDRLEKHTAFINMYPDVTHAMLEITEHQGRHIASFRKGFMQTVGNASHPEPEVHEHRPHFGCPAAAGVAGDESLVSYLWRVTAATVEKTDYWDAIPEA